MSFLDEWTPRENRMRTSRFSIEQIVAILKEHEAGCGVADLCRRYEFSQ
jgi:putative transposase